VHLVDLGFLKDGLELRINAVFIIGALIMLAVWNIQHYGILRTARVQLVLTIGAMTPLLLLTIVPILTGDVVMSNFSPFVPINGSWNIDGWSLFLGGLFIAVVLLFPNGLAGLWGDYVQPHVDRLINGRKSKPTWAEPPLADGAPAE